MAGGTLKVREFLSLQHIYGNETINFKDPVYSLKTKGQVEHQDCFILANI